jgi:hypothetical protein
MLPLQFSKRGRMLRFGNETMRLPMRAIQIMAPRQIAVLDDAPRPDPAAGEVLVKCSHAAICGSNMGQYTGKGLWGDIDYPKKGRWCWPSLKDLLASPST